MALLTARGKLLRYLSSSTLLPIFSVMAITPQDIAQQAGQVAKGILGAVPGVASGAAALYIKEGTPSGVIPNVGVALARKACRRYAENPDGPPGPVAAALEDVCRPYLDDIGYGSGPGIELPFRGGQCPGVNYSVTIQSESFPFSDCSTFGPGASTNGYSGPIRGLRFAVVSPSGELCTPGQNAAYLQHGPLGNETAVAGAGFGVTASILNVVPEIPGTPECGNPPPIVTQPGPPAIPDPPGPEPYSPGPGIDIDIDVEIGPEGNITFNIGTGPIVIDPFGGSGGGGDGGGSPVSGLPPGDIGSPAAPVPTDPAGNASGCAPANSVLVGVKVNIVSAPPYGSEYDPLVRRGVCYVYMGTSANLGLIPEGVAMRSGQMFFAPLDNLTCWEVNANTGYVLQVIPYYRALEPEEV